MKILVFIITLLTVNVQADVTVRIGLDGVVLAAKQRGELFRMLGYYTQLLTRQNYHYPDENLQKNINEYEEILTQFTNTFSDKTIQNTLANSLKVWKDIKPELKKAIETGASQKLEATKVQKLLDNIVLLCDDMKNIQKILSSQNLIPKVQIESQASSDIIESSARLSTYYLINTSHLSSFIDQETVAKSSKTYEAAFKKLEASTFNQGKIFQKRFKGLKKIHYFNTMTALYSKTAIPALMIKKNNKAFLDAFVSLKLITAASTEGIDKTVKMFF